jgi:hypothetical protein
MGLFNIFKRTVEPIDFSDSNLVKLTKLMDELGDTLIKSGFGFYVEHLSQIRLAAEQHNLEKFKEKVINRGVFGGAGVMWEIWIKDNLLRENFNNQFCEFVDQLKKMGIKNKRVNQVRKGFTYNGNA